ncbi:unnamed protein product [Cunninghamella blakesleeana]
MGPTENDDINILSVFPNLQHIDGLKSDFQSILNNKLIYLQLQQPTNFLYCADIEEWAIKFNHIISNLKTLHIYNVKIIDNVLPKKQVQQQQQLEIVYLKTIGYFDASLNSFIYMLILQTLSFINLIEL